MHCQSCTSALVTQWLIIISLHRWAVIVLGSTSIQVSGTFFMSLSWWHHLCFTSCSVNIFISFGVKTKITMFDSHVTRNGNSYGECWAFVTLWNVLVPHEIPVSFKESCGNIDKGLEVCAHLSVSLCYYRLSTKQQINLTPFLWLTKCYIHFLEPRAALKEKRTKRLNLKRKAKSRHFKGISKNP